MEIPKIKTQQSIVEISSMEKQIHFWERLIKQILLKTNKTVGLLKSKAMMIPKNTISVFEVVY
jgi:hypothetical protein